MYRSFNEEGPGAAASAVAYLDERRARRLGLGQREARDRASARLGEAVARYERHVLAWYALDRHVQARAARAAIVGHERTLVAAQLPLAAPAPRHDSPRVRPLRPAQGSVARLAVPVASPSAV